jgi:quercetin dioxygenase-like cupin family protein
MSRPSGEAHRAAHSALIDYRLPEITGGAARGVGTVPGFCMDKPAFKSPWHYHECRMQIDLILEGSVEVALQSERRMRLEKGDVVFIPGKSLHDISYPSADYQVVEFTFPEAFTTIEADMPAPGLPTAARAWGISEAVRTGLTRGILSYAYPVEAPYREGLRIEREYRCRPEPFLPGSLHHDGEFLYLFVIRGSRSVELAGQPEALRSGDLLVLPGSVDCRDIGMSDDYEALIVATRSCA